ncbi:HK97-gp10 family putative phage morphogenesis protein [uncultured Roseobacter sp.]|uniref:HK97-gp10 family putative phage morphogenesis protein n=1 Tax=uncultured Roseobacter sp. TaxID=114847 RepID=UPI0026338533|nr:HK97-gp10 family putative phage morphogenesis protein [uncultured Roseobacter sp.]
MSFETVKLEGFSDLDRAFEDLSAATGKNVLLRAAIAAAEPMARAMRSLAPKDELDLSESIDVSTKLSDRQAKMHRKMFRNDRDAVEVFVGPGPDPAAHIQEFGTEHVTPQPFARPAFDQEWRGFIDKARVEIADQLERAAARAARKAARAGI